METNQGKEIIFVMTFTIKEKNDLTSSRLFLNLVFRRWLFFREC